MSTSRRQFLTIAGASTLVSMSPVVPEFLLRASAAEKDSEGERILVVVQLSGGNDGLNTVVPFGDDEYYRNRFALAINRNQVLKIDDYAGLHPSLNGFSQLLEAGKLAIVQGVGYPNPNRSHFESMDLWHSAHRAEERIRYGWLGRYLDATREEGGGDVPAMHFGQENQPLALTSEKVRVPSIRSLERFRLELGGDAALRRSIEQVTKIERPQDNDLLGFVQQSTTGAIVTARRVEEARKNYKTEVDYGGTGLAQKMKNIAQLIDAGLRTRIYYVTLGGFDTHSNQAQAHNGLLRQLSDSVFAFLQDIANHGHGERVLVMSFSEFGRRVKENASQGTDHGAAAPLMLAGAGVKPGLIGRHPSLTDLEDGDLKFHTDYRRVYATVLEKWLGWKSEPILGGRFETMDALRSA